jgi:hypothetical protein
MVASFRAATSGWRRAALAVAAVMALTACGRAGAPASTGAAEVPDPGVLHVHRLAVDPADPEALYIATHTGLFRSAEGGQAERIGDRYHDLMGFTITEDGRYLASGHPDLRSEHLQRPGAPPLLGLVESTDGGADWDPVSLLGETDFHALEARHGQLYAADSTSGRFMVSADGVEWETRSSPALQYIAVSPDDPDLIVGGGGGTPLRTLDGGRAWNALAGPVIAAVAWDDDALYALDPEGGTHISTDAGDTWADGGALGGQPEALLAADDTLFAAVAGRGILRSDDGGRSWEVHLPLTPT